MKKMIFLIIISSIITAQPQTLKRPFSPKEIPNSQDIHRMVNDQIVNRSTKQVNDQTGRPTREEWQTWNGSAWVNDYAIDYTYAPAKPQAGKFPDLITIFYWLWVSGVWQQNGHENWTYDGDDNLIEVLAYDKNGIVHYRRTYIGPFVNGQATKIIESWYENGFWIDYWYYWYWFDVNGCVIDEVWEMWNGSAWIYWSRIQHYYTQPCCPDRWVFSYWQNNAWTIYYMAAFTYTNCMTDIAPFSFAYTYLWYLYACNPSLVLMGETLDGINMTSVDTREEFTYNNCLAMTYIMYDYLVSNAIQQLSSYIWNQIPGKVLSTLDNSNQRMTSQITQLNNGTNSVNSTRTWYSYEGLTLAAQMDTGIPSDFTLKQNYPNPFNPSTTISFDLSEETDVRISIYDMTGRLIRGLVNRTMTVGSKTINWDGKDDAGNPVSGGIYLYNLQTGDYSQTKKMVLMK